MTFKNNWQSGYGEYRYKPTASSPWSSGSWSLYSGSTMVSSDHPMWRARLGGGGDVGGYFYLDKFETTTDPGYVASERFEGDVYPGSNTVAGSVYTRFPTLSDVDLVGLGTDAIARVAPQPSMNIFTSLGELVNDGIPAILGTQLWRDRAHLARGAGKEHLNVEFGWKPLVADVQKFARTVLDADATIAQYRRDSGQAIRRRYSYPIVSESRAYKGGGFLPHPTQLGESGVGCRWENRYHAEWFSGAFRYHVPVGIDQSSRLAEHASSARRLLGGGITPEVLWELTPWSWAIDWFTNTGSVMSNISNLGTDGLAMEYGYMMHHTRRTEERYVNRFSTVLRYTLRGGSLRINEETKVRLPSRPFGFSIDAPDLSSRQISILAALGISRR